MSDESLLPDISILGDDDTEFFRDVHGRILNTLNPRYMLPVDRDEIKVRATFRCISSHPFIRVAFAAASSTTTVCF